MANSFLNAKIIQNLLQRLGVLETQQGTIPPAEDYNTIADIRALTTYSNEDRIFCLENQIIYIFNAASTATDNGTTILKPTNIDTGDPGRWVFDKQLALKDHTHTAYAEKMQDPAQTKFLMSDENGNPIESTYDPNHFAEADHTHSGYTTDEEFNTLSSTVGALATGLEDKADKYPVEVGDVGKPAVFDAEGNVIPSDSILSTDELAAIQEANIPSATNPFATINDIPEASVDDLATEVNVDVAAGTPNTVTLNMDSKVQKVFKTDSITEDVTLLLSNATNMRVLTYNIRVTGTVVITLGGSLNWRSEANDNWDPVNDQITLAGESDSLFEISVLKTVHGETAYYKVKFTGNQI